MKTPPLAIFDEIEPPQSNYFRFRVTPEVLIAEGARVKIPGEKMTGEPVELIARHHPRPEKSPYERLLGDAIRGDGSLFSDDQTVEAAWAVVDNALNHESPVETYKPGSWGPKSATNIIEDGERWHDPTNTRARRPDQRKRGNMKPTQQLHDLGQSLWLDNITRTMLDDGTLAKYISDYSITGLTSNPSIFDAAIGEGDAYDASISEKKKAGLEDEKLFTEIALEDLRRAADLFKPVFEQTKHIDGWVSMEVSPMLASDTNGSIDAAKQIHELGRRENLFVKIPGTPEGVAAIEEVIFLGIPVNVTLAVFARAIPCGGRSLSARHRAAHRERAESGGRFGGVGVHQPMGCRSEQATAGKSA